MRTLIIISWIYSAGILNPKLKSQELDSGGVLVFDLMNIYMSNATLQIYNEDGSIEYLISKELIYKNHNYKIREFKTDSIKSIFNVKVFEPDYDLLILDCTGKFNNNYRVIINNKIFLIKTNNPFIKFETIAQHILKHYVSLNSLSPLHQSPNEDSPIIENYIESSYIPLEIRDNWLKVKCFYECEGCYKNKNIEGWVKWKDDNGKILIDIFYIC